MISSTIKQETGGDTFDRGVGEGVEEESLDATTLEAVRDDGDQESGRPGEWPTRMADLFT